MPEDEARFPEGVANVHAEAADLPRPDDLPPPDGYTLVPNIPIQFEGHESDTARLVATAGDKAEEWVRELLQTMQLKLTLDFSSGLANNTAVLMLVNGDPVDADALFAQAVNAKDGEGSAAAARNRKRAKRASA